MSRKPRYTVSIWDHDIEDFVSHRRMVTARAAMKAVRELEHAGWDRDVSIAVKRHYTKAEIKKQHEDLERMLAEAKQNRKRKPKRQVQPALF